MAIWPRQIRLEASSACQLKCPSCPTATGATKPVVGNGFLRLEDFAAVIDDNPWLTKIELSNYGEVFLNPHLLGILERAHRERVEITISNGANLNHAREAVLEGLVKYRVRAMTCSLDGASPESYKIYRRGGDFEAVIANIVKINRYKQQYGSEFPRLSWQFVVFGHNEAEIPRAKEMARALGMEFYPKMNWDPNFSPIRNAEFVKRQTGWKAVSREEHQRNTGKLYLERICHELWTNPQVNWDGKILGCCRNFWGDFGGNAFSDGLATSLNNEKMAYARAMLQGEQPERADIPCTSCDLYHWRRDEGAWIKPDELPAVNRIAAPPPPGPQASAAQAPRADAVIGAEWAAALRAVAARLRRDGGTVPTELLFDAVRSETRPPLARTLALARAVLESGWLDEAEAIYRALTIEHPAEAAGFAGLARIAVRRRRWMLALERWTRGVAVSSMRRRGAPGGPHTPSRAAV